MDKVNTSFNRGRDGDLVNHGYRAVDNMTNNPFFPEPNPTVAELMQATQEYQQALYDAEGRDQKLVSVKNDKRAILRKLLTQMAEYVNSVARGDRTKLLSSGFRLARNREDGDELKAISELEVQLGGPGEATIRVKRVAGAKAYNHEYTTGVVTNESVWVTKTIVEPLCTFKGLQPGVKYSFRVIAIGRGERSVHSPIVSRFIQ